MSHGISSKKYLIPNAGVECIPAQNAYFCGKCPEGTTGTGKDCWTVGGVSEIEAPTSVHPMVDNNPCSSFPCFPNVTCFSLGEDNFVCGNCPAGMTGDGRNCSKYFFKKCLKLYFTGHCLKDI